MKAKLITIIFSFIFYVSYSQNLETCGVHTVAFSDSLAQVIEENYSRISVLRAPPPYVIPVVVHDFSNVSDADIVAMIARVNQNFSNSNIEFCLAKVDPSNNPTTGILHSTGSTTQTYLGLSVSPIPASLGAWDVNNYLNIYLVDNISNGVAGFSFMPWGATTDAENTSLANYTTRLSPNDIVGLTGFDGLIMLASGVNSTTGYLATHEIAHYLGVPHPFFGGGLSGDPRSTSCYNGDGLGCTPPAIIPDVNCNAQCVGMLTNNYMQYKSCTPYSFAGCQNGAMYDVLDNQRSALVSGNRCTPAFDLAVNTITPTQTTCQNFTTVVSVTNEGQTTLTSFDLQYSLNGAPYVNVNWTGSVPFGQSRNVNLPTLIGSVGSNTLIVKVRPNRLNTNNADQELTNDSIIRTFNITAPSGGSVSIASSVNTICDGESVTLTASGGSGYQWSPGTSTATTRTVSPSATTTYTLTGLVNGCQTSDSKTITVKPLPTTDFTLSANNVCPGTSVTLSGSGANSYSWDVGGTNANKTVSPTTTTTYTLTGTTNGCSSTRTRTLTVLDGPNLAVTSSVNTLCGNESVTLTGTGATTYSWSTGATTASITETQTGNVTYTLTGTRNGCTQTVNKTINHNPYPVVAVNVSNATICDGETTTLTASGATTYSWSSGQSTAAISVSPSTNTNYTVTGTTNGCSTTSASQTITVKPLPILNLASSENAICQQDDVTLTASGNSTGYTWSSGDVGASITKTPMITTNYTVTGTLNGCSKTLDKNITVYNFNEAIISGGIFKCEGENITLSAQTAPNYNWSTGGNSINEIFKVTKDTIVRLIVRASPQCPDTAYHNVTMNKKPILSSGISEICLDENVMYNLSIVKFTNGYTINNIYTNTALVDLIKPTTILDSNLVFFAIDDSGCQSNDLTVLAKQIPEVRVILSEKEGCEPLEVDFSFNCDFVNNIIQNEWDFGDGATSDLNFPNHIYEYGTYDIFTQHLFSNGCKDSVYLNDTLYVERRAIAQIGADKLEGDKIYSVFNFVDNSLYHDDVIWKIDGNYLANDSIIKHDFQDVGIYNLCLRANTPLGCEDSTCVKIEINDNEHFLIPNSFTPNGDGKNETFKPILNVNPSQILKYQFRIFDKWGNLVFETQDMNESWDGKYQGQFIGQKMFIWDLDIDYYKFVNKELTNFNKKGHVMVIDYNGLK